MPNGINLGEIVTINLKQNSSGVRIRGVTRVAIWGLEGIERLCVWGHWSLSVKSLRKGVGGV